MIVANGLHALIHCMYLSVKVMIASIDDNFKDLG